MCKGAIMRVKWMQRDCVELEDYYPYNTMYIGFDNVELNINTNRVNEEIHIRDERNFFTIFAGAKVVKSTLKQYMAERNFERGDTFKLRVEFDKNTYWIYHNEIRVVKLSLNGWKAIYFKIQMQDPDDEIGIIQLQYLI